MFDFWFKHSTAWVWINFGIILSWTSTNLLHTLSNKELIYSIGNRFSLIWSCFCFSVMFRCFRDWLIPNLVLHSLRQSAVTSKSKWERVENFHRWGFKCSNRFSIRGKTNTIICMEIFGVWWEYDQKIFLYFF